jgi:hypothetical protein
MRITLLVRFAKLGQIWLTTWNTILEYTGKLTNLLVGHSFTCSETATKSSGDWFDWGWDMGDCMVPYPTYNRGAGFSLKRRKNKNTMNDLIEAAIDITEDATSIAQELLEKNCLRF